MPTRRVWRKHRSKDSVIQKKTSSTISMILTPLSETNFIRYRGHCTLFREK